MLYLILDGPEYINNTFCIISACPKKANFSNFCVPDERDLSTGSNFNPQNTQCMDACPDFIGVVNPRRIAFLELEKIISFSDGH
jgi:hypothetical protein